jgi:hypothetical protein
MAAPIPLVLPSDLGADFDKGVLVANQISVVFGSTTVYGKVRFATTAELTNGTASVAIDAADLKNALANMIPFATASTPGVVEIGQFLAISAEGVLTATPTVQLQSIGGQNLGLLFPG